MGIYSQSNHCDVTLELPENYDGGFWTLLCGIAPHIDVDLIGDWRPKYFSISADRAFNPEAYAAAQR